MKGRAKRGYTLIELLLVFSILIILLSTALVYSLGTQFMDMKNAKRETMALFEVARLQSLSTQKAVRVYICADEDLSNTYFKEMTLYVEDSSNWKSIGCRCILFGNVYFNEGLSRGYNYEASSKKLYYEFSSLGKLKDPTACFIMGIPSLSYLQNKIHLDWPEDNLNCTGFFITPSGQIYTPENVNRLLSNND